MILSEVEETQGLVNRSRAFAQTTMRGRADWEELLRGTRGGAEAQEW